MVRKTTRKWISGADSYTAKEIEKLQQESQALNQIRHSMSSDNFPRKIFEKVFKDDINRLRSMEDMWKTRKPPTALNFDELLEGPHSSGSEIAKQDQKVWTGSENLAVFCDRSEPTSQPVRHRY